MESNTEIVRAIPPLQMFEAEGNWHFPVDNSKRSEQLVRPTILVDTPEEGGVLSYMEGEKYPLNGWFFREAVFALDTIKRASVNALDFLLSSPMRYLTALGGMVFILLPKKLQQRILDSAVQHFTNYTTLVFQAWGKNIEFPGPDGQTYLLESVVWKPQYFCTMVREIRRVLFQMADGRKPYEDLATVIAMFFEFDDAYRYRAQDGLELIDRTAVLKNPGKELSRIFSVMAERGQGTAPKFRMFSTFIPYFFKIKIVRDAVVSFFSSVDLTKLYLDEADWYRCLFWTGYHFRGVPDRERIAARMMVDAEWHYHNQHK